MYNMFSRYKILSTILLVVTSSIYFIDEYVVDHFDDETETLESLGWHIHRESNGSTYELKSENESGFLFASTSASDMMIVKKIEVDIVKYPYVNWSWRINTLPINGDESIKSTCDVPASISFVTNKVRLLPKSIKYSWSTTLEKGTATKSPFAYWPARTDIIVMQSGDELAGEWVIEKRNILEDYKKLYGKKKLKTGLSTKKNSPERSELLHVWFFILSEYEC